jgi:hypothetical protein
MRGTTTGRTVIRTVFSALLFTLWNVGAAFGNDGLWIDEVNIKSDSGKDFIMKFEELERAQDFSIVRVQHTSGASVPSSMFVAKGMYTIAKQRGVENFINLKEWRDENDHAMYKVGFANSKEIDLKHKYGNDIKPGLNSRAFMSARDFDILRGNN